MDEKLIGKTQLHEMAVRFKQLTDQVAGAAVSDIEKLSADTRQYVDGAIAGAIGGAKASEIVAIETREGAPVDTEIPDRLKGKTLLIELIDMISSFGAPLVESQVYGVKYSTSDPAEHYSLGSNTIYRYMDTIHWYSSGNFYGKSLRFTEL